MFLIPSMATMKTFLVWYRPGCALLVSEQRNKKRRKANPVCTGLLQDFIKMLKGFIVFLHSGLKVLEDSSRTHP
jgi:hypothetical protein